MYLCVDGGQNPNIIGEQQYLDKIAADSESEKISEL